MNSSGSDYKTQVRSGRPRRTDRTRQLRSSGPARTTRACARFTQEKTPSFTVSPTKRMFYCYGCKAGGNASISSSSVTVSNHRRAPHARRSGPHRMPKFGGASKERSASARCCSTPAPRRARSLKVIVPSGMGAAARAYLDTRGINDESVNGSDRPRAGRGTPCSAARSAGSSARSNWRWPVAKPRNTGDGYYDTFRNRLVPRFRRRERPRHRVRRAGDAGSPTGQYLNSPRPPCSQGPQRLRAGPSP